jgi:hypothetical protein
VNRRIGVFLLAGLAAAAPAAAQVHGVVQGRVVAARGGTPVSGATMALTAVGRDQPVTTTTNDEGRFAFPPVAPGRYQLSVSAPAFRPRTSSLTVEPREVARVALSLEVAGVTDTVHVTASSVHPSAHSPSSTVLTSDRLQALAPADRVSLPDAMVTLAPGMIRGHDDFVHIRGQEVALNPMINGVFFWENPHALFSAGLSPEVIETANVMTGGFPAEYGHRFGGVVDAVTKSGFRMRERGRVTFDAGGAGQRGMSGEAGGQRGRLGAYLFGRVFESDRFLSPPDREAIHDRGRSAHVFLQLDGDLGPRGTLQAIVMGDGANLQLPVTPQDDALRPLARAEQRTRQQTTIVNWTRTWAHAIVSTSAYQRWSEAVLLPAAGPLTARADLERRLTTFGGKVDVTRIGRRHTIKGGLDAVRLGLRERLAYDYAGYRALTHQLGLPHIHITGDTLAFAGADAGGQFSAYVQDAVELSDRVSANVGVRLDHHRLVVSAAHVSPRINVTVRTGAASLHASYNRFFVPPPVEGALSTNAGLTASIREIGTPLPPIEPTIEDQVELGVTSGWRGVQVGAAAYHRASDNPVHTTVWPDSRIYSYASFDRARAYGLELRAAAADEMPGGFTGYLNYALGRVNFFNPVTGGFITEAGHVTDTNRFLAPMDQTHTLTGAVTWRHRRTGFWASVGTEYGSGTPIGHGGGDHEHGEGEADHSHGDAAMPAGPRVPGHWLTSFSSGVDLVRGAPGRPRLTVTLHVRNVTDRIHVIATEGPFSPAQYSIPRLATLSATVGF